MLKYFPFSKTFDMRMGTSGLPADCPFIHVDENYFKEIHLKRELLQKDHHYYYQTTPGDEVAQWEVLEIVLHDLARNYPEAFNLTIDTGVWRFRNKKLNEDFEFNWNDSSNLPFEPLDWVGRQVQEDLLVLNGKGELISGQLCFPSGWSLDEKMGKHFLSIHEPLPDRYDGMLKAADKLMERIPAGKPIQRVNWGFRICDELDMSTRHGKRYLELLAATEAWDEDDIDEKLFVRVEYQTLHRLPSGKVLFTVHTYLSKVSEEAQDGERARGMLDFLTTVPADVQDYKLIKPYTPLLVNYLRKTLG